MIRLLRANYARIFRSWYFQLGAVIFIIVNVVMPISTYRDMKKYPEYYTQDVIDLDEIPFNSEEDRDEYIEYTIKETSHEGYMFDSGGLFFFIIPIIVGLFIGTDYSDGTIRNKLVVGHTRINLYLANLITCISVSVLIYLAGIAASYITSLICFKNDVLSASETFLFVIAGILITASWTAICTLISMLLHSKAGSVVITLLIACFMAIFSVEIIYALTEPEFLDENVYMLEESATTFEFSKPFEEMTEEDFMDQGITPGEIDNLVSLKGENPNVPHGVKREIFKLVRDASPGCQIQNLADWQDEYNDKTILWSSIIILLTTSAGIFVFRKQNLK